MSDQPVGTVGANVEGAGQCWIPDAFGPYVRDLVAALDWARVHNTSQNFALSANELDAAARAARDLAEQCEAYANDARENEVFERQQAEPVTDVNAPTVEEVREALRAGKRVRIVVGTAEDDPTVVLTLEDGCVMSESVAGWSAGVVEPVCGLDSDFLRTYLLGRHSVEIEYRSQSARDAQAAGTGNEGYWDYLDQAALASRDYWLRHGEPGKAAEMLTRSLGEALMGNDGP